MSDAETVRHRSSTSAYLFVWFRAEVSELYFKSEENPERKFLFVDREASVQTIYEISRLYEPSATTKHRIQPIKVFEFRGLPRLGRPPVILMSCLLDICQSGRVDLSSFHAAIRAPFILVPTFLHLFKQNVLEYGQHLTAKNINQRIACGTKWWPWIPLLFKCNWPYGAIVKKR